MLEFLVRKAPFFKRPAVSPAQAWPVASWLRIYRATLGRMSARRKYGSFRDSQPDAFRVVCILHSRLFRLF